LPWAVQDTRVLYHRQLHEPPDPPVANTLSTEWEAILRAALSPDPRRRPQSMRELMQALASTLPAIPPYVPSGAEILRAVAPKFLDESPPDAETVRNQSNRPALPAWPPREMPSPAPSAPVAQAASRRVPPPGNPLRSWPRDPVLAGYANQPPILRAMVIGGSQREVLAIEKDTKLFETLTARINSPRLKLLHDDALDYLKRELRDWSDWKVVSNLPYSVASPILVELAQAQHPPELIVATLQLEVAKRLMAAAGEKDYGVLTLLIHLDYEPKGFFKVPASCFFPEPDVDSGCVRLARRVPPLLKPTEKPIFRNIVKRSFSQRRKMMLKVLKEEWPAKKLEQSFEQMRLPVQTRAENVTLEQFVLLTGELSVDSTKT